MYIHVLYMYCTCIFMYIHVYSCIFMYIHALYIHVLYIHVLYLHVYSCIVYSCIFMYCMFMYIHVLYIHVYSWNYKPILCALVKIMITDAQSRKSHRTHTHSAGEKNKNIETSPIMIRHISLGFLVKLLE